MKTKRRPRKTFSKVLSVVLCLTILISSYAGFFSGFGAAAGKALDIAVEGMGAGEVAVTKGAVQDDRSADITVNLAAKPGVASSTSTEVVEKPVDLIMIIDSSNSMTQLTTETGKKLFDEAIASAKQLAKDLFALNANNRIAVGNFSAQSYSYKLNNGNVTRVLYKDMIGKVDDSYFVSNYSDFEKVVNSIKAESGTNTEGGYLVANALADYANNSAYADRQKVVLVMTDGLPQDRYTADLAHTNDQFSAYNGVPSYLELTELLASAKELSERENVIAELVFFTGGLANNDMEKQYRVGSDSGSSTQETVKQSTKTYATMADRLAVINDRAEFMSVFYGLKAPEGAKVIGDMLAVYSGSGVAQYPTNAAELLVAFKSVINTVISSQKYDAALNAVYTDIIPEYYDVDESSINVTTGTARVLRDQQVTINGTIVTRDVVEWTIGTIPAEVQSLSYTINVNDPKLYGILNVAEQGILTYEETAGTVTHSPLIVQIDEIILAPKGADDYYIFNQGENLDANNKGVAGVLVNDDMLNTLVDESGNGYDSKDIVNGNIAGLDGKQASLNLEGYTAQLVEGAKNGQVVLNEDGTFTYIPDSSLYEQPVVDFVVDENGTNEYNYSGAAGWEDTFTYVLDTNGTGGDITKESTVNKVVTTITPIYGPDLSLVVFENMEQTGADVEGAAAIGGNLVINGGWSIADKVSSQADYTLIVGGTITGQVNMISGKMEQNQQWIRDYVEALEKQYTALSRKYSAMDPDGTAARNQWYTPELTLTADPNHVAGQPHVFYVDGNDYIQQVKFIGDFGDDDIIINISGKSLEINGGQWALFENTNMDQAKLQGQAIWNFYEMENLSTSGFSFQGCVLAPFATYTASNGHTNGVVIVKEMIGTGGYEYHMGSNLNKIAGGTTVDIITETTTESETIIEVFTTTMDNYVVTGNEEVKVKDAIESEVITVHIRILPNLSELGASKDSDPKSGTLVKSGEEIEYTITVTNPCSVPVSNIVVNDSAPFGTTITDANGGTVNGRNISFTIDKIAANGSATVSFTVTVDEEITGTNNLANTASITYTLPGDDTPDTVTTNTVNHAVLTAEKSSSVAASTILAAGDEITYTIAVTNNGTADASNVNVVDTLPDGVTFKEGNVDLNGNIVSTTIASIAAGKTAYVSFTVTVNQISAGTKVIENTATVNGEPTNTTENVTKYGTVVVKYVDEAGNELIPGKSQDGKTGDQYGPYPAEDIDNYRHISTTGNVTGTFTDGVIEIIHVYAKIPGFAVIKYVDEAGNSLLTSVTVNGWQGDELTDLKQEPIERYEYVRTDAPTTILTEEGITIIHVYKLIPDSTVPTVGKTANPADGSLVVAGETIVYTISVTNNKYEAMTDVVVTDTAPAGTTISDAGNGTVNGSTVTFVIPSIESGATATVSFAVTVDASISGTGNLANTAYVTYRDRESTIDQTIPTNTTGHAILTAVKAGGDAEFYGAGDVYTYNITVTNNGSAAAQNVVVTDTIPEGVSLYNAKNASVNGDVLTWTIDKLEAGASKTVAFDVKVNDTTEFVSTINNTAYVNDIPTNTTEDIVKKGTVDVQFVDEAGNALADSLHYEGKPGTAHGTTDAIDIYGYQLKTTTGSTDGNFVEGNITIIHVYERLVGTVVISYIDKDNGQNILPDVSGSGWVGDAIESDQWTEITNYTYVSTDKPAEMVFIDGNVHIIHYYTFIEADDTPLVLEKASLPASGTTVRPGEDIEYIITLTNTRVDDVNNVVIEDYIPDGMTFVSASTGGQYADGKVVWNVGTIPVGASKTVFFTARVNDELTGSGNLRNVASATYTNRDNEPEDRIYSNEITHPILDAKLESFTNQPDANLTEGDQITYKITVTNEGSVEKTNIPVIADIPEGTTFVTSEDGICDGDNFVTTIPELQPGETVELYYTVVIDKLPDGVYEIDIPNIAEVDGDNTNDVLDKAYVGILVVKYVDYDGTELCETSVTRARVGTGYGALPVKEFQNREFDYVDGARVGNYIQGTITVIFHYKLIPATLTVKYIDKDTGAEIKNTDVYPGFNQGDVIPGTYAEQYPIDGYIYDSVVTPDPMQFVTPSAEIIHYYVRILDTDEPAVEKISNPASGELVKGGDTITYSIAVTNVRATDSLENVVVTDAVPAGTIVESIANNGVEQDGVITWNIGSIAAGETKVVSFTVKVEYVKSGSNLGNIAHVSYKDIQTGEDKEIPTNPTSHALLTSNKTSSVPSGTVLYAGDIISYNVDVTNIGTADANDVTVYDVVPNGTGIILSTLTNGASYNNGKITYVIKSLKPGETKTLSFSVQVSQLADGEYAKVINNTAVVDGDNTNTTENIVKRGTLTVKYQDTAGNTLHKDIVTDGAVGTTFTLPAEKKFENLKLKTVTYDSDSKTYIEGNITYIYIYERIPAVATVKYLDISSKAPVLEPKTFNAYVGDILESDYYENVTHYNYVTTDKPSKLVYTEEGLVIIHYYEYIFDSASILREKTASPASGSLVEMGDEITYTITVTNPRYDDINNVIVTDAVPAGTTFVSADNNGVEAGGKVTWNLGTLPAGQTVAVSFIVKVADSFVTSGNLHNIAQIVYTGAGNTEPTTVVTNDTYHAVLTYDKAVDAAAANTADTLTYTINVKNEGCIKAENVVVTDTVPANTTLVESSVIGGTVSNGVITWNIDKIEAGESVELTFKVDVDPMPANKFREVISNKAKVNGDETNEVETVVTQGTVIVTHVADDGTVLRPEDTVIGHVGDPYSYSAIDSPVYEFKNVEGDDPVGVFVEGVKYIKFIYTLRNAGLVVNYLESGTNKAIAESITEEHKVNDKITNIYKEDFITFENSLYEFDDTDILPDTSLEMTKDGIVVNHYYSLVPTGDVVVKYVDTNGKEIAGSDSSSGNIYQTYTTAPKAVEGYIYSYIADGSDPVSGNYPANDTNEVVYVYVRATGTLVVRYLEVGTDNVLWDHVSEVYNTGDTVTNLHERTIDKYDYNSSIVPDSLVMTENGLEVIHYYTLTPTGTATAHYVDRNGNELIDNVDKAGTIYESYTFNKADITGWHFVELKGEPQGNFPADSHNDVYYIYEKDTGVLTVHYLDVDTNESLSQAYNETFETGTVIENLHYRDFDLYEKVAEEIPADLTMTTAGLTITYWYRLIPTGDAVAKFVDTEGNTIHKDITAAGNIYETYDFNPIDIPGYKLVSVEGTEEGNFPANETNVVIYTYERCVGNLTVNYLEKGTEVILAEQYTEVIPTLVEVEDLHEKTIAYYNLVEKNIPDSLVMTEEGIVIDYYYAQVATGTVVVNYVDEDYNPLLIPETVNGVVGTEFAFTPETIDGYKFTKVEGDSPEGAITEEPQEIFFIYTREQGVLNISYLEEGTDKVLADGYTETMETGETVTDIKANSISGYIRTNTEMPESLVMTTDGIDIIHYYKAIPMGKVNVSHVDEEGNELIEGETMVDFVDVEFNYKPADIPGYELIEVKGEPEGVISEDEQDVMFIYRRLNGTLHITYIDETTGEPIAESYNEVFNVGDTVKDLKEKDIDGYNLTKSEIPEDLTMTEKGLDVVYYYTPDTYTVSGTTWIEGNNDSVYEKAQDVALSDIRVVLYDANKTIVGTATTDRNGEFEIDGVLAGKYTASFDVPSKYKVVNSLPYSKDKTNSIANYNGDTGVLSVTGDTPNVGMGVEGIVLGSTATNEQQVVKPQTPQVVYTPTTTKQENATYTKVLGDTGVNPSTGDTTVSESSEDLTVVAVMLASCSLFVLTLTKKKGSAARR